MKHTAESAPSEVPWLLRHKVELPDPIEGYVERPELEARCALVDRYLTVLHAPGGFGKTVLLSYRCRSLRERGVEVAWLSLDEEDGPESVAAYLELAFQRAGLDIFDVVDGKPGERVATEAPGAAADSRADYRINLLIRALERHSAPCVLAIDEVERLRNPDALVALNAFLRRAPRNLHVGMAFRERPPGLDIAMFSLEGRGAVVTVEDLRFSMPEVARFFHMKLSRRELASVVDSSAGWPLALRIYRNTKRPGAPNAPGAICDDTVAGWVENRLWRGMSAQDRDFVLDIALFDWVDPDLIKEATGMQNPAWRLASMGALTGLLSTTGGAGSAMRLHPLVKDYCEQVRFKETPDRFRAIHRGIARALARRGRVVEALHHASAVGSKGLVGRIVERAGGVNLWLEEGLDALRAVDGLLTEDVLSRYPRVALVRCVALTISGAIHPARSVYLAAAAQTAGFTRDRKGGDDRALQIDHLLVYGLLEMCGCKPYGNLVSEMLPVAESVVDRPEVGPMLRGVFSIGICMTYNQKTAFDLAVKWAERARAELGRASPYLAHVDFQVGSIAMARGHTHTAQRCYESALKIAKASHLCDAGALVLGQVLAAELEFERCAGAVRLDAERLSSRVLGECSAWLDIYAASTGVGAELALLRSGLPAALDVVEDAYEHARRTERDPLLRFLSALRVVVLLAGGQVQEAERVWQSSRLPECATECTDLKSQSWREAEMLSCARLQLLIARGEFDAARDFADALRSDAAGHSLVRTLMRGLALSMALESQAGDDVRARAHLLDYLRLFSETDYVRPLMRERAVALALLEDVAQAHEPDTAVGGAAVRLRAALHEDAVASNNPSRQPLSRREIDVLERLERYRDKEIASALDLTCHGVRYHVSNIFAKLGARGRMDAVHRARARGILPALKTTSEEETISAVDS